jgi:soluble lytic murein transglycosylase-like protein
VRWDPQDTHRIDCRAAARTAALLAGVLMLGACTTSGPAGNGLPLQETSARVPHAVPYRSEVSAAARRYAVPTALLLAIIHAESSFDPHAVSHKGAVGLMQLMPATARWMEPGVSRKQLFSPAVNIEIGARYLRYLANRYDGDAEKILIAWNAGPGRLDRGRIPRETRVFVRRVRSLYGHYAQA